MGVCENPLENGFAIAEFRLRIFYESGRFRNFPEVAAISAFPEHPDLATHMGRSWYMRGAATCGRGAIRAGYHAFLLANAQNAIL